MDKTWHQGMAFSFTRRFVQGEKVCVFRDTGGSMMDRTWHQGMAFSSTARCIGPQKVGMTVTTCDQP